MRWLTSFVVECTNSKVLVLDEHFCIDFLTILTRICGRPVRDLIRIHRLQAGLLCS